MATTTFSWSNSSGVKCASGADIELDRDSGSAIPSNANIISISWWAYAGCSKGTTDSDLWEFQDFSIEGTSVDWWLNSQYAGSSTKYWNFYGGCSTTTAVRGKNSSIDATFEIANYVGDGRYTSFLYKASVTIEWEEPQPEIGPPQNPKATRNNGQIDLSWDHASYTNGSSTRYYNILYSTNTTTGYETLITNRTTTKYSTDILSDWYDKTVTFWIIAHASDAVNGSSWSSGASIEIKFPSITKQPSITNINPASGQSTTITWSSATVTNQYQFSIKYQYFVGPSSTYSDSYHIGTADGTTANITEQQILSKCGASFSGTCYLFVRAYWTDGTLSGGWTTPSVKTFIYESHRTVKRYKDSTTGWEECIVYRYSGNPNIGIDGWEECEPYRYNGSTWEPLSF